MAKGSSIYPSIQSPIILLLISVRLVQNSHMFSIDSLEQSERTKESNDQLNALFQKKSCAHFLCAVPFVQK